MRWVNQGLLTTLCKTLMGSNRYSQLVGIEPACRTGFTMYEWFVDRFLDFRVNLCR